MKKLELNQMETIQGGDTAAEYCATVKMILENNDLSGDTLRAMQSAAFKAGCYSIW